MAMNQEVTSTWCTAETAGDSDEGTTDGLSTIVGPVSWDSRIGKTVGILRLRRGNGLYSYSEGTHFESQPGNQLLQ
jgi:hypothetical protein